MSSVKVKYTPVEHCKLPMPSYQTAEAAGMDLMANAELTIEPGQRALVPCGFSMEMPVGVEAQVRPRSGLALKHGITLLNSPGTIDSDYRGEIKVIMINHGDKAFEIKVGDRVAQMVIAALTRCEWVEADALSHSERGEGGFGHTGGR